MNDLERIASDQRLIMRALAALLLKLRGPEPVEPDYRDLIMELQNRGRWDRP